MPIFSVVSGETRAHPVLYGWLAVTLIYLLAPVVALLAFNLYLGPLPVPLSYVVYLGALFSGARLCDLGIRSRTVAQGIVGATVTIGIAVLIYVTLTYCPQ